MGKVADDRRPEKAFDMVRRDSALLLLRSHRNLVPRFSGRSTSISYAGAEGRRVG